MSSMAAPPLEELLPDLSHLFFKFFLAHLQATMRLYKPPFKLS